MRRSSAINVVHTGLHGKVTGESLLALRSRTAINLEQVSRLSDFTVHLLHARAAPVQDACGDVYYRLNDSLTQLRFVVDRKLSLLHLVDLKVDIPCCDNSSSPLQDFWACLKP